MKWRIAVTAVALLCASCCYYSPSVSVHAVPGPGREPMVRVRLSAGSPASISSDRGMVLSAGSARQSVAAAAAVQVLFDHGIKAVQGARTVLQTGETLLVTTAADGRLLVGDRSYRGSLLLFKAADGGLAVVNALGLEEYLFGVVPCEIGPINNSTMEAVKAQAVAARSFTLTRLGRRQGLGHDLFDSYMRNQEYEGAGHETELGRQAVMATRGEVMMFRGEVVEALYHANCGGVTNNGSQPYLRSVPDTPGHRRGRKAFCADKPNFTWQVRIGRDSLGAVVSRLGGRRISVRGIRLEADRLSGRVRYLYVSTDHGEVKLQGEDFRAGLGLKSQNFKLTESGSSVVIDGRGYGHGVGMCQDGAVGMAVAGYRYKDILRQYYSGVSLKKRY